MRAMEAHAEFADPGITGTVRTWSGPAQVDTDAAADDAALAKRAQLTERYCVVAQSLAAPPQLAVRRAAG
ncbi:hypothetical protein [Blastococcus sp. SYSU DS0533]